MSITPMCRKRLMNDRVLLKKDPHTYIDVIQDPDNMLFWYFLIKGPDDSEYKGGYYIGKIEHDPDYPMKAPNFYMLTPNGRFDINKKICLSNSGFHSESWSPMWTIRAILDGFLSIMLEEDDNKSISHIKRTPAERAAMAKDSIEYNIKHNLGIVSRFNRFLNPDGTIKDSTNNIVEDMSKLVLTPVLDLAEPVFDLAEPVFDLAEPIFDLQQKVVTPEPDLAEPIFDLQQEVKVIPAVKIRKPRVKKNPDDPPKKRGRKPKVVP